MVYTSSAAFLSNVTSGSYTESFDGLPATPPTSFSSGAFSYTVSASGSGGLYGSGDFLGTSLPNESVTFNFTSGNVKAVGGNFFISNLSDVFQAFAVSLTLSDGTVVAFTPATFGASFRGFVSDTVITSLVFAAPGISRYASIDNLTVGTTAVTVPAIPEPTTWALMGLGLAGVAVAARRRQA